MTTWKKSEKEIIKHRVCPSTELVWALVRPGTEFVRALVCPGTELVRALSLSKCHLHKQFH